MKETIALTKKKLSAAAKYTAEAKSDPIDVRVMTVESNALPSYAPTSTIYITSDTGEIYQGTGTGRPLKSLSDIIFMEDGTLPKKGIPHKLYINFISDSETFEFSVWNTNENKFVTINSGNLVVARLEELESGLLTPEEKKLLKLAADNYEDIFDVPEGEYQSVFHLTHKPIGKIRLYIDGIRHFASTFEYNKNRNSCTWVFTSDVGGFDIEDAEVIFEYDYDPVAELEE